MNLYLMTILALAFASARSLKGLNSTGTSEKLLARLAWLFVALFTVEAISKGAPSFSIVGIGFLYIGLVGAVALGFGMMRGLNALTPLTLATTTFGAGNRGIALLSAICSVPVFLPHRESILFSFVQIDSVVIVWLITIIPYLLSKISGQDLRILDSIKSFVTEAGYAPIVMVVVVILGWILPTGVRASISPILEPSSAARGAILLYLCLTLVILKSSLDSRTFIEVLADVLGFYLPRLIVAVAFVGIALFFLKTTFPEVLLAQPVLIAVLVLAICPPSNLLPVLLEQSKVDNIQSGRVSDLNIVTTLFFVVVLAVASAPAAVKSLFGWLLVDTR